MTLRVASLLRPTNPIKNADTLPAGFMTITVPVTQYRRVWSHAKSAAIKTWPGTRDEPLGPPNTPTARLYAR
jgi:hypothetical protein